MFASLRVLLEGAIDYAGLFPPARLPLDQAIRNYAHYRTEPESWMLGRFVCPAARLAELGVFAEQLFKPENPLLVAALGGGGKTSAEFQHAWQADREAIASFEKRCRGLARVEVYETKLPHDSVNMADLPAPEISIFLEIPFDNTLPKSVGRLGEFTLGKRIGAKWRCGGLEPSAFPSVEMLSQAILSCRELRVPLKFTAGLHHPLRHFDRSLLTPMHGFLNVYGAGVLVHGGKITEGQVREILADKDPGHFTFDEQRFRWQGHQVTFVEIAAARGWLNSFGSCSFDEPRADLRKLGLLPERG